MSKFTIHERLFECEQSDSGERRTIRSANDYSPDADPDSPEFSEYVQKKLIVRHPDGRTEEEWVADWDHPLTQKWERE